MRLERNVITHVVMFKLQDDKKEQAAEIQQRLQALPAQLPMIRHYEIGLDVVQSARSYDVVLISTFDTHDDLNAYSQHPIHLEVVKFIKSVTSSIIAVDYESE